MEIWNVMLMCVRSRCLGLEVVCYQHDLLQQFRVREEEYQCIGCVSVGAMMKLDWRCERYWATAAWAGSCALVRREMPVEQRRAPGYVAYAVDTEVTLHRQAVHRAVRSNRWGQGHPSGVAVPPLQHIFSIAVICRYHCITASAFMESSMWRCLPSLL